MLAVAAKTEYAVSVESPIDDPRNSIVTSATSKEESIQTDEKL